MAEPLDDWIVADPEFAISRTLDLTSDVKVTIRTISFPSDEEVAPLQGDGVAFVALLADLDGAVDQWVGAPLHSGSSLGEVFIALGESAEDPAFPFGIHKESGVLSYRGPLDSYLTFFPIWREFADGDRTLRGENGLYNWWTALEIRSGQPVLYLFADKIAG